MKIQEICRIAKVHWNQVLHRNIASSEKIKYSPIDFRTLLTDVHPHLLDTPIPEIASNLICSLQPFVVQKDTFGIPESDGLVRGSVLKRHELDDPPGYTDIPAIYRDYENTQQAAGDSPFTGKVTHHLTKGLKEVDIRAIFKNGEVDMNPHILPALIRSLSEQDFQRSFPQSNELMFDNYQNGIQVLIRPVSIGTPEYPRTLYNVTFSQRNEDMLTLDIADLPKEDKYEKELRLNWQAGMFELTSVAPFKIQKNTVTVFIDSLIKSYPRYMGPRSCSNKDYLMALGNGLREIGSFIFWPARNDRGEYDMPYIYRQLATGEIFGEYSRFRPREPIPRGSELELLRKRSEFLISDYLLYFTYNPFLFLELGFGSRLLEFTPLGMYIRTIDDMEEILDCMQDDLVGDETYQMAQLSEIYHKQVLQNPNRDLRRLGPLMLIRALNKMFITRKIDFQLPETMEAAVNLLNPLILVDNVDTT